jgi:hypothetical protein
MAMRVQLTKTECIWLAELAKKEKENAAALHEESPHRLFLLRQENMEVLERKLNGAVQREIERDRSEER